MACTTISFWVFVQLLDSLPHTVRGVGQELMRGQQPGHPVHSHGHDNLRETRERDRITSVVGFIIVVCPHSELKIIVTHWQKDDG